MNMNIDWNLLAKELGCCDSNIYSTDTARKAMSSILGADAIIDAIEHYISFEKGAELARQVLILLRSRSGMEYCYNIFKDDRECIDRRRAAIELLRAISDQYVLKWVPEFLNDSDEDIQIYGASLLKQLYLSNFLEDDDYEYILDIIKCHQNLSVQEEYQCILNHRIKYDLVK